MSPLLEALEYNHPERRLKFRHSYEPKSTERKMNVVQVGPPREMCKVSQSTGRPGRADLGRGGASGAARRGRTDTLFSNILAFHFTRTCACRLSYTTENMTN